MTTDLPLTPTQFSRELQADVAVTMPDPELNLIVQTMVKVGQEYSQKALDASNPRAAKAAFAIARDAFRLVIDAKLQQTQIAPGTVFPIEDALFAMVDHNVSRPFLYSYYVKVCLQLKQPPMSNQEFYSYMRKLGLKERKINGEMYFIPPTTL